MGAIHATGFTQGMLETAPNRMYVRDDEVKYSDDKTEREYTVGVKGVGNLLTFRARPLPGCCGVIVAYYIRPKPYLKEHHTVSLFQNTIKWIVEAAAHGKFGAVLFTQIDNTLGEMNLTEHYHFPSIPFTNWKTGTALTAFLAVTPKPVDNMKQPPKRQFAAE